VGLPAQRVGVAPSELRHVRFLGGGSGSGKTTVAGRLAAAYALRLFSTERFSGYVSRTAPADAPLLHTFLNMDMDERWVDRSPEIMQDTFHAFHGESFHLVVEDLLALPKTEPILAEGFSLLPRLVGPLLCRPNQALWLLATPEFRRAAFESRGSTWDIPRKTSDPDRALSNVLARDALFTEHVRREAEELGLPVLDVRLRLSVDELVTLAAAALGLA
jgi:2-phosphoglycerate kinase